MEIPKDKDLREIDDLLAGNNKIWTVYRMCIWWIYKKHNEKTSLELDECFKWCEGFQGQRFSFLRKGKLRNI